MCSCDLEYPTLSSVDFPTARKPHRCDECDRTIPIGQKYRIDKGKLDGEFYQSKTCSHCQTLAWWADRASGGDFCFALGELHQQLLECDFVGWDNEEAEYTDVPDDLFVLDGRLWPSPELAIAQDIAMAIDQWAMDDRNRESWRSHIGRQIDLIAGGRSNA